MEDGRHEQAGQSHERAAHKHEQAALHWAVLGEQEQAALERDLGAHERAGAELERRWAQVSANRKARGEARPPRRI